MRKLTLWKEKTEVWIEGDEDGNTEIKTQWFCSDGISIFYGDTKSEAAAHFGVPVGFDDNISKAAATLGRAKSDKKSTSSRENGRKGGRPKAKQPVFQSHPGTWSPESLQYKGAMIDRYDDGQYVGYIPDSMEGGDLHTVFAKSVHGVKISIAKYLKEVGK